jgi:hypothetical protein
VSRSKMSGKKKTTEVITTETEVTPSKSVCFILLSKCVCVWWCFSDVVNTSYLNSTQERGYSTHTQL